mmetsp:Transcript_6169/g.18633  ORF Transcript_6169/g.18633 Transcript_6169/m.18633 type:complete len:675 (+) Transcript_6169:110-2134(+)
MRLQQQQRAFQQGAWRRKEPGPRVSPVLLWRTLQEHAAGKPATKCEAKEHEIASRVTRDVRRKCAMTPSQRGSGAQSAFRWYQRHIQDLVRKGDYRKLPAAAAEMHKKMSRWKKVDVFNMTLLALGSAKKVAEIARTLKQMKKDHVVPNQQTYDVLMYSSIVAGDHHGALHLYQEMRAALIKPSVATAECLITVFDRLDELKGGIIAFEVMRRQGVKLGSSVYNLLISMFSRRGDIRSCLSILQEMQHVGTRPTLEAYKLIANACTKRKQFDMGAAVYENILHSLDAKYIHPSLALFNVVLQLFSHRKVDNSRAVAVFNEIERHGLLPNAMSYSSLCQSYGKAGNAKMVESLMAKMRLACFEPNTVVYNGLIDAHGRRKDLDKALSVFYKMLQLGIRPSVRTYNTLIYACVRSGRGEAAAPMFSHMRKHGVKPNLTTFVALVKSGNVPPIVREAFEEHRKVNSKLPNACAYDALIQMYLKSDVEKAVQAFEEMMLHNVKPKQSTYDALMTRLISRDEGAKAVKLYEEMRRLNLETGYTITSIRKENGSELKAIVRTLTNMMPSGSAAPAAKVIADTPLYSRWIEELGEAGDLLGASNLMKRLRMQNVRPDIDVYNALLDVLSRAGDVDGFLATIEQMKRDGVSTNDMTVTVAHQLRRSSGDDRLIPTLMQLCRA